MKKATAGNPLVRGAAAQAATASNVSALVVEIKAEVQQRIRHHARSFPDEEICGMLIGVVKNGATVIENTISGEGARQAGTHVTFTQEAWAHVYEVKDAKYPEKRIVGWYHSHPGFGVFLSDHDLFIHNNFFSDPNQVAWVFDPHSDEEGCFVWQGGKVVRLQTLQVQNQADHSPESPLSPVENTSGNARRTQPEPSAPRRSFPRIAKWAALAFSHILVLIIGFLVSLFFFGPEVIYVPVRDKPADSSLQRNQFTAPETGSHNPPARQDTGKDKPK